MNELQTTSYKLNTGDIIKCHVTNMPFILHYGIVVVEDEKIIVYHNTPMYKNTTGGSVVSEPINEFLKSRTINSINPSTISATEIKQYSSAHAEMKFDLIHFNCEHFIFGLTEKKYISPQLNLVYFLITLFAFLYLNEKNSN